MPRSVEINSEPFLSAPPNWSWATPGADPDHRAWSHASAATDTQSAGPDGGADPVTRAVRPGNGYAFTEASDSDGPWAMESPAFDAGAGGIELTFDLHLRFGTEGGIDDGVLAVQGWDGSRWSTIPPEIRGSKQRSAADPYKPSKDFGTYDSRGFVNADFKFRLLFTRGSSPFSSNYDCAVDNLRVVRHEHALPNDPAPTINAPRTIVVDPADGNGALKAALSQARGGDLVRIKDGTYFGSFELRNKDSSAARPIWIRADNPGKVVVSNLWRAAFEGRTNWRRVQGSDKLFQAALPNGGKGPFMGSYTDDHGTERFLFRYRTKDAITRDRLRVEQNNQPSMNVKNPRFGFAVQGNQIFLRLKDGADPRNRPIRLTQDFGRHLLTINRSRHVIVDGIKFEGSGKLDAVICTPKGEPSASSQLTLRNCLFEHCRRALVPHNEALVEWCEYTYPGFREWMDELQRANDQPGAIFALVKGHFNDHPNNPGNAFLEGGWAENLDATPTGCVFEFNLTHGVFEGHRLGALVNSRIQFEAADGIGDDWVEFEHHQRRSSKNNRVIACKILNCHGSFISAQDKNNQISGPNYVSRCIFDSTDETLGHPPFVIKNQGLKNENYRMEFFNNFVRNPGGRNPGFGSQNFFWWDSTDKHRNPGRLRLRNNLVVFDRGKLTGSGAAQKPKVSRNLLVNDANRQDVTGNGGKFLGQSAQALRRDSHGKLLPGSPAIGAGSNSGLNGSQFVDVDFGGRDFTDAGPFPNGFDPGPNWPRPFRRSFSPDLVPKRWPFVS